MSRLDAIDKNISILIADDYALTRDMVRSILKQYGFGNVLAVEDGRRALEKIREMPLDLVICDWNMPGMSGLEVLRAVRADQRFRKLRFLMLTAESYRENVVEALKAGVSDYMVKPFTAMVLAEKLESLFCPTAPKP
jgi:two-component system, chemotaxis family, chemotaxis protein CheY